MMQTEIGASHGTCIVLRTVLLAARSGMTAQRQRVAVRSARLAFVLLCLLTGAWTGQPRTAHAQSDVSSTNRTLHGDTAIRTLPADTAATVRTLPATAIAAIDSLLTSEVEQENVAGAVVLVAQDGEVLHSGAYGFAQRYSYGLVPLENPAVMTVEHIFDLASLTKVFATTFAVMLLVDSESIDLDYPVHDYLPEFTGDGKEVVTLRHLLTHTAGLYEWLPLYYQASTAAETYEVIAQLPLKYEVGAGRHYSDLGFMLLGYVVERVAGRTLDVFLREALYEPLGLRRTTFNPLENKVDPSQIAATSHGNPFERRMVYDDDFGYQVDVNPEAWDGWRDYTLRGEVNDGNAFYANDGVAGHAGLFSTADDLQVLVDLLQQDGRVEDDTWIRSDVIQEFLKTDSLGGNALGWALQPEVIQARGAPHGTFGHTGFTGTSVVVIPEHDLSIILLTNRQNVGPDTAGYYYDLNPTRQRLVTIVLGTTGR